MRIWDSAIQILDSLNRKIREARCRSAFDSMVYLYYAETVLCWLTNITAIIITRTARRRGCGSEIDQHSWKFGPLKRKSSAGFLFVREKDAADEPGN